MRDLKAQEKLTRISEEQLAELYKQVFTTDAAQVVLEDLRNRCFFFEPSYSGNKEFTDFNEGKRSVILHIETQLLPKLQEDNGE